MKTMKFFALPLCMLLVAASVFANGNNEKGDDIPKTLIITNVPSGTIIPGLLISTAGVSPTDALQRKSMVAGGNTIHEGTTATTALYAADGSPSKEGRWTGNGTYDIYFGVSNGGEAYRKLNVVFNAANITLDFADFAILK